MKLFSVSFVWLVRSLKENELQKRIGCQLSVCTWEAQVTAQDHGSSAGQGRCLYVLGQDSLLSQCSFITLGWDACPSRGSPLFFNSYSQVPIYTSG